MSFMNPFDHPPLPPGSSLPPPLPPSPPPPKTQEQKDKERWLAAIDNIAKPQPLPPTEGSVWLSALCARLSGGKAGVADAGETADAALAAYKKRFPTTP